MLSNTATPKYYGEFRQRVLDGIEPVNKEIALEMNRIDANIANPNLYYDSKAIDGFVAYCESELTLVDGDDLSLLYYYKLWAEACLSWFYFVERSVYVPNENDHGGHYVKKRIKKRLINKQYLIVGRGAAKTLYLSCLQDFTLNIDTTTTKGVTTAPTTYQADEVLGPLRTSMQRKKGPLKQFLCEGSLQNTTGNRAKRQKLCSTKLGIQNFLTNSIIEIRPMTIDKLQGLRTKMVTVDEWLSGDVREDVIGAAEQGCAKIKDYLIVAVSSEGTVRNGPGDTIKLELMDILKGDYVNPHVSIWWYKLDDVKEVGDPSKWKKANPGLGVIDSLYETYQLEVERAEKVPAARNDILAKRFGLPMEGFTYFFSYDESLPHRSQEYWGMPCALGIDLSHGDDFCAFDFLFPLRGEEYGIKTRCYISSLTMTKLPTALRIKYEEFLEEGSLIVMDCNILDLNLVYEDLDRYLQEVQYDVRAVGYDPWNAKEFIDRWVQENGPFGIEKIIQGSRTESVPLGHLKTLAEERALIFDQSLFSFCMQNSITIEDTNGNRKLSKKRHDAKIDAVAACLNAWITYNLHKENFE